MIGYARKLDLMSDEELNRERIRLSRSSKRWATFSLICSAIAITLAIVNMSS